MHLYPLTHSQNRIWITQKKYSDSSLFNIGGSILMKGDVNLHWLRAALVMTAAENPGIRLRLQETDTGPMQYVSEGLPEITHTDFSSDPSPEQSFEQWRRDIESHPFDMQGALFCFYLFTITPSRQGFYIKLHHILADGWSIQLITNQVREHYENQMAGRSNTAKQRPDFTEVALSEQQWLASPRAKQARQFWSEQCKGLSLPDVPQEPCLDGRRQVYRLDKKMRTRLDRYLLEHDLTWNAFFTGVFLLWRYKRTGVSEQVLGIPLLGRTGKKEREMVGNFTNTMPLVFTVDRYQKVRAFLQAVSSQLKTVYRHQKYPYDLLYQDAAAEGRCGALYDTCVNYYNTALPQKIGGCPAENTEIYNGQQEYALQMIIRHWEDDSLQLDFDYRLDAYSDDDIKVMYQAITALLEQVYADSGLIVKDCLLADPAAYEYAVCRYNETQQKFEYRPLFERILQNARQYPDRIAVSHGERSFTYRDLLRASGHVMNALKQAGVQRGDILPFRPDYEPESIMILLAILQCGAVYLPLDQTLPDGRVLEILERIGSAVLISSSEVSGFQGVTLHPAQLVEHAGYCDGYVHQEQNDLCYMIFTSGSTGLPKGVQIRCGSLMNYLQWAETAYLTRQPAVFALYASFSFDFTLTSIFLPLMCGGEIRIYHQADYQNVFRPILLEKKVTVLKITPSHIPLLLDIPVSETSVQTVIVGGETLKSNSCRSLQQHLGDNTAIFNEYGPTEATIGCMTYRYQQDESASVPVGRPIANMQVYLLDHDCKPLPAGIPGEMYLSGAGLADGYFKDDAQTRSQFLPHPFLPEQVLYRTGDRAVWDSKGNLYCLGRIGGELKIRGHRISCTEIEHRMVQTGLVKEAVARVVLCGMSEQLAAYVVPRTDYSESVLRQKLEQVLPEYMIPALFIEIPAVPLTEHGKLDEPSLPEPEAATGHTVHNSSQFAILKAELCTLLKLPSVQSGDNYYALGGDSIKAIQLVSRLQELGYGLTVREVLTHPVLADMAACIQFQKTDAGDGEDCRGKVLPLPIVNWFTSLSLEQPGEYVQSVLLRLNRPTDPDFLEEILRNLVRHHDSLRLNYDSNGGLFYNDRHLHSRFCLHRCTASTETIESILRNGVNTTFDIAEDLLVRAYFIESADGSAVYLVFHHLCMDGVSIRIFLEDLARLMEQGPQGTLPDKTCSYQRYAEHYLAWAETIPINPAQFPVSAQLPRQTGSLTRQMWEKAISPEMSQFVLALPETKYDMKPEELLFAAAARAASMIFPDNACFELESHGRDALPDVNISRTIGWFTALYRVGLDNRQLGSPEWIDICRQVLRAQQGHQHEYGISRYINGNLPPCRCIRFNYMGSFSFTNQDYFTVIWSTQQMRQIPAAMGDALMTVDIVSLEDGLHIIVHTEEPLGHVKSFFSLFDKNLSLIKNFLSKQGSDNQSQLTER